MSQPPGEPNYPPPGSPYDPAAPFYGPDPAASLYGPTPYAGPPAAVPDQYDANPYAPSSYGAAPYGPYAAAPYGGNPYEAGAHGSPYGVPAHHGPQHAGPVGPPAYGYAGHPYGAPPPGSRVSEPTLGWVLLGTGVLAFIGALLPWATVGVISVDGTSGDGALTLLFGMIIGTMGLIIALRQGRLWASIVATVFAGFTVVTAIVDIAHISTFSSRFDGLDLDVRVGGGLWLTLVAGIAALGGAVLAIIRRRSIA